MLGNVNANGEALHQMWSDPVSENPSVGEIEVWEFHNFTADAHPIHIHEVMFQVLDRQTLATDEEGNVLQPVQLDGAPIAPFAWETGPKDTVTAYPGQVARVKANFDRAGLFVWHCHIVEHEDHEMMRPYRVGPPV